MLHSGELIFAVVIVGIPSARLRLFAPLRRRFACRRLGHRSRNPFTLSGDLDLRHATSSAFKGTKVKQIANSRRFLSEPHDLTAARAKWQPWPTFIRDYSMDKVLP